MSEAVAPTALDMLHRNVPQPAPEISERRRRIEERAAALIAAEFIKDPPANPWWTEKEVAIRDRCFEQAQEEVAIEFGVEAWKPKGLQEDTTDWSVPPRMGLKLAISERQAAVEFRGKAAVVAARASDRLVALELELSRFHDLDAQVDACRLEQARSGDFDRDLPYALASALKDRALCMDRLEHAKKASDQLQSELRQAERALQAKDRIISAWASRIIQDHADNLADELARVRAEYDQRRAMLYALTYMHPPHSNGPMDISYKLHEALHAAVGGTDQSYDQLRPMVEEWSRAHHALTEDPDAPVDVA